MTLLSDRNSPPILILKVCVSAVLNQESAHIKFLKLGCILLPYVSDSASGSKMRGLT